MAIAPITQVSGTAIPIPGADIDTDRIIPARFMKCVTFDGLGEYAFYDVRFDPESGEKTDHPLNDERFDGASILVAGINFGCGSSREHAPQSLTKYGFSAIIAESFAEIFYGNSTTLGLPCVSSTRQNIDILKAACTADPTLEVSIDLDAMTVTAGDLSFPVEMPASARQALLAGKYDPIKELLDNNDKIEATAASLSYVG
ncbi:MAG: 3-isopropylmalate dehydratase small subunit [Verrucomicrobia bacterium]|jgi:3-isopropylmalate/(R)-2-methylmalate dehydratase small subunit|nr:3-isopropylmalate dehydratase small subunit [Verrucomicrobiota bacterium]MDA7623444.1 3-isopropylmalate dehydratase small subunit [bacterium]MDB4627751.1 3-isopropylmalate dehydratase small subunit [Akkermansiaceae bacterium]MBT7971774.1 3-isopropylmalate dehydratase small subunit [Verrucomicrobiota bacterium]MDB4608182.1 3-isopropylmalate dehydratase small subunit [bacterium]